MGGENALGTIHNNDVMLGGGRGFAKNVTKVYPGIITPRITLNVTIVLIGCVNGIVTGGGRLQKCGKFA